MQAEYRVPLVRIERGPDTVPFYLNRMYGSVFVDYGDAYRGALDLRTFRVGAGAELLTAFTLGYFEGFTLRLGAAYGFDEGGGLRFYANLGAPF